MNNPDLEFRRDRIELAFEIMLSEFSAVKRASIIERVELAWEQNEELPLIPRIGETEVRNA